MEANGTAGREIRIGFAAAMGATEDPSAQCFTIYIPNKDRRGAEFGGQRKWVLEALRLLARLNGGATAMPPAEGVWRTPDGEMVWEDPVVVYSFLRPEAFFADLPAVREFLHRMGRETDQGEIAVELDGRFYRITSFDPPSEGKQP